jgi:hypothetical protein
VATTFKMNEDRSRIVQPTRDALVFVVEYRGGRHPVAGCDMHESRALQIESYLQGALIARRVLATKALRVDRWTFLLTEPYVDRRQANRRFVRLARGLSQTMFTPFSSGYRKGVPFWGTMSALLVGREWLEGIAAASGPVEGAVARALGSKGSAPPFAGNTFHSAPVSRHVPIAPDGYVGQALPALRGGGLPGSYPGSTRFALDPVGGPQDGIPLQLDRYAGESVSIDVWGTWVEVVPVGREAIGANDESLSSAPGISEVVRDLEPLIAELWAAIDSLNSEPYRVAEQRHEFHLHLIQVSDASRRHDGVALRVALVSLQAVVTILLGLTANALWERYGDEISKLLDRLPG